MSLLDHLTRDARHAFRTISRMRLLAAVVVVSLGVGIGVNVVVFSWLQAVVLQPLPGVEDARQLVFVEPRSEAGTYPGVSWQEYEDLRDRLRTFDSLIAFRMVPFNVGEPSRNERVYGQLVSGNYFGALGLTPSAGRFFRQDEVSRGSGDFVVVVSHGLALARFGSPAAALGQTLRVNDRDVAIVGVAPEHFQGTVLSLDFSMWIPATLAPSLLAGSRELDSREVRGYAALGRLRAGATQAQAQADVERVMRELARVYPASNGSVAGEVMSFWAAARGPQSMITGALAVLQGLMLLVLVAVCGNTANLMLARASTRQREVGVRLALGAGRARIVSVLLAENVLLALGGGLLGAALAAWGTNAIRAVPFIGSFPIRFQTDVDALGLAVAMALALACGVLVGLPPALHLAGIEPQRALRNGNKTVSRNRMRSLLMAAEVALALIVLLVGGLFYRSLTASRDIDTGFRRAGVLLAAYDLTGRDTSSGASRDFAGRLLTRLSALPGIESAAIATSVPLDIHGLPLRSFRIEGHARPDGQPERALSMTVSRGYFATLSIPLVEGTDFADFASPDNQAEVIVNEEFVRRFVAGGTPLGRRVQNGERSYRICGVARTTRYESFEEDPTPVVYFSFRDRPSAAGEIHVRTREGAEMAIAADLRRAVREVDASLPLYDLRTMSEHVEKNLFLRRVPARMFAVLGPLLLVLAAIGIYAVVAYGVAQRTTEIGVRLALGATGARVVGEVVRDTLRIVAAGAVVGWLAVYVVQIHIAPGRPLALTVFVGVPLVLLSVAFFASWLPAQRAARVDPMVALRHE